jgi:hypothetical protein
VHLHGVGVAVQLSTLFINEVEAVVVFADVAHWKGKFVDFDLGDSEAGHF